MSKYWFFIFILFGFQSQAKGVYLIVNKSLEDQSFDRDKIRNIYLGKLKFWENGKRIKVARLDNDNPAIDDFYQEVLNKNQRQLISYWRRLLFTGKGVPPVKFRSSTEIKEFVESNQGAIGFLEGKPESEKIRVVEYN